MQGQYNMRSPAVKRLMMEARELAEPTEQYFAQPLEDNLFEWHFTIRGPADTEFDGGVYHGRIILPPDYPMKPPSIILLNQNGRFETHTKICLSISKHHPESWQPSWSIRTALLAIIGFMPTPGQGAIGSLDYTPQERKVLARRSVSFCCDQCGLVAEKLLAVTAKSEEAREEMKELAAQLSMSVQSKDKDKKPENTTDEAPLPDNTPATTETTDSSAAPTPVQRPPIIPRQIPGTVHPPSTPQRRSRTCWDAVTYYTMMVLIVLMGMLLARRAVRSNFFGLLDQD